MHKMLKLILLISLTSLMAGCRLAVIVVEGGEVRSNFHGVCVAGAICVVDVDDPNFWETFEAVPEKGWSFQNWSNGDRFFCAGSTDRECTLSFGGYEDTEEVHDMVTSSEMFYLMPVFRPYQDIVTVDGRDWWQPSFFSNLSPNDITAVCPEGVCAGSLNGVNLSGWMWASIDEVIELFNAHDLNPHIPTYDEISGIITFQGGNDVFSNFAPIGVGPSPSSLVLRALVRGFSSTPDHFLSAVFIVDSLIGNSFHVIEASPDFFHETLGAWFWRPIE